MHTDLSGLLKLDADLVELVQRRNLSLNPIPVILLPEDGHIDAVVDAVKRAHGRVRHVMRRLNGVAAWVPGTAIEELATLDCIAEIELDQPGSLA